MNTQVLVVGAGPVGLTMAAELARYGVRVRVIDKNAQRSDKSKALAVWSRTLELLERSGCAQAFVETGHKTEGAAIFSNGKRIAQIDLTKIHSAYNYALMLPQSESERLLENHLQSLGLRVEREVEATAFTDEGANVKVALRHADGNTEQLQVDWLIGCDGAHSFVRHGIKAAFEGETMPSDWILADVHLQGLSEIQVSTYLHPDGVLALFPITTDRYRVIANVGMSKDAHPPEPTLEQVRAIVDRRGPGGLSLSKPIWLSGFRINERKVANYRKGRIFLAGDAAHVHSPAGGQGMNTGMQDAFNLAWKLALICRGSLPADPLLDSYSIERSAVGKKVLADSGRMTQLGTLRNPIARIARNLFGGLLFRLPAVKEAMARNLSETAIAYSSSPLNGTHVHNLGGAAPGQRVAPASGQTPIGSGHTPYFEVLAEPANNVRALLKAHADLLAPELRQPPQAGALWLVRPDGYIACVAREAAQLDHYLQELKVARSTG